LDVYESADELRDHIPPELHAAVVRALGGDEIEILDI
jgi:EXLDI family protein